RRLGMRKWNNHSVGYRRGEELKKMGMNIINDDITGRVHKDRKVLTGDSPFAANALGKLAAQEMLAAYAG
ncbi:hypothetical protein ACUOFC_50135, partial [Escherichia sp. TWPC-MK]